MMRHFFIVAIVLTCTFSVNAQVGLFEKPQTQNKKKVNVEVENRTDEQGRKQGVWMNFHPNGNPAYKARFNDNIPVDTMIRYYPDGKKFVEIVFDQEGRKGCGQFFSEKGNVLAEGYFLDMQKDSVWQFFDEKGNLKIMEMYRDDKRNGESRIFFNDGTLAAVVNYSKGEKEGLEKRFYPDGSPRVFIQYKNGQMHGKYVVFYKKGIEEIEGYYNQDRRDSTWVFNDAAGQKKFSLAFDKGEPLNKDLLDSMQREEFRRYEHNRDRLKDPEEYRNRPEEYIRGF
jgi:antitoxin component YwqK of YwqJK toxin-antitoxin module